MSSFNSYSRTQIDKNICQNGIKLNLIMTYWRKLDELMINSHLILHLYDGKVGLKLMDRTGITYLKKELIDFPIIINCDH